MVPSYTDMRGSRGVSNSPIQKGTPYRVRGGALGVKKPHPTVGSGEVVKEAKEG